MSETTIGIWLAVVIAAGVLGYASGLSSERQRTLALFEDYRRLALRVGFPRAWNYLTGAVFRGDRPGDGEP